LAPPSPKSHGWDQASDGVEPGHTISTEGRSRVRMLLSFQRPSYLFREGASFPPGTPEPSLVPERTDEYSAESGA
jgi:hypothetical protein